MKDKSKKVNNKVFKSFADFEKNYLPETHRERISSEPADKHSQGILLAKEFAEEVRLQTKC